MPAVAGVDHAFLVAGLIRIVGILAVVENGLPPTRQSVCVGTVHRGVRHVGGHRWIIARPTRTGEPYTGTVGSVSGSRWRARARLAIVVIAIAAMPIRAAVV